MTEPRSTAAGRGLDVVNASFEKAPPTWEQFATATLEEHRFVALDGDRVEQGRGVGTALMARLLESTDAAGIWTVCAGIFPENVVRLERRTDRP